MQKLLNSILRNGTLLLFIFLLALSFLLISRSQRFQQSNFVSLNNSITSPFFELRHNVYRFFERNKHNQQLIEENQYLISQLITQQNKGMLLDSLHFEVIPVQVLRNSIRLVYNYITINAGTEKGVSKEMGVITAKGVVGVIHSSGKKTSSVISILNKSLRINAKLKKSDHFGSLYWDGVSPEKMLLADVPLVANVALGDTVVTGGMSAIFPGGIHLGVVDKILVPLNDNYYNLQIALFEDITRINHVYAVKNPSAEHITEIITTTDEK